MTFTLIRILTNEEWNLWRLYNLNWDYHDEWIWYEGNQYCLADFYRCSLPHRCECRLRVVHFVNSGRVEIAIENPHQDPKHNPNFRTTMDDDDDEEQFLPIMKMHRDPHMWIFIVAIIFFIAIAGNFQVECGIIPIQAGTNKYASQKGMTGFGAPRDVVKESKVKSENLAEITDEAKIASLKGSIWLQSGTNKFASQKGMTGMGTPRDVNYRPIGSGGAGEVPCSIESSLLNNNSNVSFNISEENNNNNCCLCSNIELKQQNINKEEEPLECSILLHVGMYSRTLETKTNIGGKENNNTTISPIYRFKIFLDSDWETPPTNYLSKNDSTQLLCAQESATVIKEVNILMYSADHSIFFGPIQSICPPFGYLEWAQIGRDQQYKKLPLTLTLTVSYTNQVIRPNNTQIQIHLSDLSGGPRTLCSKKVKLFLLPKQTNSSLCRISASLLKKQRRNSIEGGGCENKKKELNISPIRKNTGNLVTSSSLLLNCKKQIIF